MVHGWAPRYQSVQLRIVDEHHHPAPPGAPGEIAVLSPFLSLGYVRGGEIVPHANPGVYFTGDSGFELPSGEIMFTGRQDDQVSIRGYRIELEEVTRTLAAHPSVREAQVLVEGGQTPRLIAFAAAVAAAVVPAAAGVAPGSLAPLAGERLRQWLAEGCHGDMLWMESRADQRASPDMLWPEVKSAVMLGMSYAPSHDPMALAEHPDRARISVYAQGRDYHDVVKGALKRLARDVHGSDRTHASRATKSKQ